MRSRINLIRAERSRTSSARTYSAKVNAWPDSTRRSSWLLSSSAHPFVVLSRWSAVAAGSGSSALFIVLSAFAGPNLGLLSIERISHVNFTGRDAFAARNLALLFMKRIRA
jgi:hypothetical protein